jgi:glycosyltransferase involved in cell wall biosynthesis
LKKIYIDITQLYAWQGKLTGIQRVMDEISRRFIGDSRFESAFIIWDKNTASFYEVDFEKSILEREIIQKTGNEEAAKAMQSRPTLKAKTRGAMKRVYYRAPLSRTMYNFYSSLNGRMIKRIAPGKTVKIEPGSLLFMPHGGVWESDTYIANILDLKKNSQVKLVTILYDLTPVLAPQFAVAAVTEAFENYMSQVLPRSDLVLAISNNTAKDARHWLESTGKKEKVKIEVFRLGDEIGNDHPAPIKVPKNYILCVGTIEARKNHTALYYAYKLAAAEGKTLPPIVVAGRQGWMAGDIYQIISNDLDTKDSFTFLHNTSDDELSWLYKNALFSVYPSFYEGWGLPIAESLLRGTFCLASNTSSMPEIAGDLIDYFSPYSPEQLMKKIEAYHSKPAELKAKKTQIEKNYKATTWDTAYKQVIGHIQEL